MFLYWILLLPVAFAAYFIGSMDTLVLASKFVFHKNLRRLGRGNQWISNFRRKFGIKGAIQLLLVEIVKDALPILFGALLLSIKGHADVGMAFAGFCLVLGRLYPFMYYFRGSHATVCLIVAALFVDIPVGVITLGAVLIMMFITRTVSGGTLFGAFIMLSASILVVDAELLTTLCIFTSVLVIFRHIPAFFRLLNRTEPKFSFAEDLSYKFDA